MLSTGAVAFMHCREMFCSFLTQHLHLGMYFEPTLIFESVEISNVFFTSKMARITGILFFHFREFNAVGLIICDTNNSYYRQQKIEKYYVYQFVLSNSQYMFLPMICINAC